MPRNLDNVRYNLRVICQRCL